MGEHYQYYVVAYKKTDDTVAYCRFDNCRAGYSFGVQRGTSVRTWTKYEVSVLTWIEAQRLLARVEIELGDSVLCTWVRDWSIIPEFAP